MNSKYQMARGKVAIIAESLGLYFAQGSPIDAIKNTINDCYTANNRITKDDVCRIARLLHYPVKMELGKWIIKTTGEVL